MPIPLIFWLMLWFARHGLDYTALVHSPLPPGNYVCYEDQGCYLVPTV